MYFAVISCPSSLSSSVADAHFPAWVDVSHKKKKHDGKVFKRRLTPNASGVQNIFNESSDFFFWTLIPII